MSEIGVPLDCISH